MSDTTGQAPTTETGQAPPTATTPQAGDQQTQTFDADYVRRLRDEAANYRTELRKHQDELKTLRESRMSEADKQAARLKDLEAKAQTWDSERKELLTRQSVEWQARALGLVDEEAAYRLMDTSRLQFDEKGVPTNVDALLKELAEARPWLKGLRPVFGPGED